MLDHGQHRVVVVSTDDHLGKVGRKLCNLLQGYGLQERALLALPTNVGNHDALLQQVVGTKLHLILEVWNVAFTHPF